MRDEKRDKKRSEGIRIFRDPLVFADAIRKLKPRLYGVYRVEILLDISEINGSKEGIFFGENSGSISPWRKIFRSSSFLLWLWSLILII